MIGDVNIFITDKDDSIGEIEIMVAEKAARGKKLGWEAVILMLIYGISYIHLKIIEAKISITNNKSIKLFNKLGFLEKSRSEIFNEITLEKIVTEDWLNWLENQVKWELKTY